jgi:hypothetical protein
MKLRWAAPCLLVLALGALVPAASSAQGTTQTQDTTRRRPSGGLDQNYPNPFNPETRIPFSVGDVPTCKEPNRFYRATLKVYNLLAQQVAVPVLLGAEGGVAGGQPIENLQLPCGRFVAYWNGKYQRTDREVASGLYIARLEIDGKVSGVKKMLVAK